MFLTSGKSLYSPSLIPVSVAIFEVPKLVPNDAGEQGTNSGTVIWSFGHSTSKHVDVVNIAT